MSFIYENHKKQYIHHFEEKWLTYNNEKNNIFKSDKKILKLNFYLSTFITNKVILHLLLYLLVDIIKDFKS